jgi:nucleoside-diphosphate-sugar epimerase
MVINIGTGSPKSINQVIKTIEHITGAIPKIINKENRTGDIQHTMADISLAYEIFGFRPKIDLHEGLIKTLDWYGKQ